MFEVVSKKEGNVIIITLAGDLNINANPEVDKKIQEAIIEKPSAVAIDCKNLNSIDSTGLGTLIGMSKKLKNSNIDMAICDIPSGVNSIFDITKLKDYFRVTSLSEILKEY